MPMSWKIYAFISAIAAAVTAILAKVGVKDVPSNLATGLRTLVVIVFAWSLVIATGEYKEIPKLSMRSLLFLGLSGVGTGISWLAYFRALQLGPVSRVAPIDKASLAITIVLAAIVLRETITWKIALGVAFMIAGSMLTLS